MAKAAQNVPGVTFRQNKGLAILTLMQSVCMKLLNTSYNDSVTILRSIYSEAKDLKFKACRVKCKLL